MKKIIYIIIFLISNICFSQSLFNLDNITGLGKYKLNDSIKNYVTFDKDFKDYNRLYDGFDYTIFNSEKYDINGITMQFENLFFKHYILLTIRLTSESYSSKRTLDKDFNKIADYFITFFGSSYSIQRNKGEIPKGIYNTIGTIYINTTNYIWESDTKFFYLSKNWNTSHHQSNYGNIFIRISQK